MRWALKIEQHTSLSLQVVQVGVISQGGESLSWSPPQAGGIVPLWQIEEVSHTNVGLEGQIYQVGLAFEVD